MRSRSPLRISALWLAAALCLMPAPARAYFTTAEVTSIQGLFSAMNQTETAWLNLGTAILTTNTTDATNLNIAWQNLALIEWRLSRGVAYLFDVNPDTLGAPCGVSRAACVASANVELAAAVVAMDAARGTLGGPPGFVDCATTGSTSGIRAACSSAASNMTQAKTGASVTYDSGLTYASPNTGWYPLVFGPHGVFDDAVNQIVTAIDQARTGMDNMRQAWNWVANGESAWAAIGSTATTCAIALNDQVCAWGRVHVRMGNILGKMHGTLMAYGLIPYPNANLTDPGNATYHARETQSAISYIANMFEFLLSNHSASQSRTHCCEGLPYHYDNFGIDSFVVLGQPMASRPTARAFFIPGWRQITIASWYHTDGSAWLSFQFPDDATLQTLRSQKNQLNDPNGPPVTIAH